MKNSELQGLFILDHNASFIPGIAGCNGEHPFVWFVFNLCAVFLQKAISRSDLPGQIVLSLGSTWDCSQRGLAAHTPGSRGKELEPAVHRETLLGGTGSS